MNSVQNVLKSNPYQIYSAQPQQTSNVVSFKADNKDVYQKQSYAIDPRRDAMEAALKKQEKEQKKQKVKQGLSWGLGLLASSVMILFFGLALKDRHAASNVMKKGGPTAAQRELGIKTKEELITLFTDVSNAKSFDEIKMSTELRNALNEIVDKIQNAKTYEEYRQEINNAILFYGPPGTGKTTFVKALCKKLGVNPFIYDMGFLKGGFQGTTEANMKAASETFLEAHRAARAKDPKHISIMFFDECDEVFQKATGPNKDSDNQILTRFKKCFDDWKTEKGVFIFGNTNKTPKELNDAIANRMKAKYIPCPTWEALSDNFFLHYKDADTSKIANDLQKASEKSNKFFKILAKDEHLFSYRNLEDIGWKDGNISDKTKALTLNDIIQRVIDAKEPLGFNNDEIKELQNLLKM